MEETEEMEQWKSGGGVGEVEGEVEEGKKGILSTIAFILLPLCVFQNRNASHCPDPKEKNAPIREQRSIV